LRESCNAANNRPMKYRLQAPGGRIYQLGP
jgi:hypothetical protein